MRIGRHFLQWQSTQGPSSNDSGSSSANRRSEMGFSITITRTPKKALVLQHDVPGSGRYHERLFSSNRGFLRGIEKKGPGRRGGLFGLVRARDHRASYPWSLAAEEHRIAPPCTQYMMQRYPSTGHVLMVSNPQLALGKSNRSASHALFVLQYLWKGCGWNKNVSFLQWKRHRHGIEKGRKGHCVTTRH